MAEEALKKLEEETNCSICLDTYTDPKLLQCFHVYCRQCLVPLVVRDQQGQLGLTCPTCRQVTPVPDRGVAGFQSAFHINRLLEIKESLQKINNPALTLEGAVRGAEINAPPRDVIRQCYNHPEEELKLYCETCGELVCFHCIMKDHGKHHDHDYALIERAFERYKEEITSSLEPMEMQVTTMKKGLAQLDAHCGDIANQRAAIEHSLHITFRRLREVLNVRETKLVGQLDLMTQEKLKSLAAQRDQVETSLAQLNSCLHFVKESLKTGNEEDVLVMKTNTLKKVDELTVPDLSKPNTEADIAFSASADMIAACQNYGQVFTPGSPDPSQCHITVGKGVAAAAVEETSTATVQAVNFEGKLCEEPIRSLECELVSEITDTRASGGVERKGQSQYEISYSPAVKGRHWLHVKAEGQHIRGSPLKVAVTSHVGKLGTPILIIDGVEKPRGVAIHQRGEMVVAEEGCVSVFSPNGRRLRSFGLDHGQFRGVAVDGEGNILLADTDGHLIEKFTPEGHLLATVGAKGSGPPQFNYPHDVAFNASNNKVYVAENHRVQVLNSDLTFFATFGREGSGKEQLNYPCGIACDSTGKVYVADTRNYRIQVFTSEGKYLRRCGQGRMTRPFHVAVDTTGLVYVSDHGEKSYVSVFGSDGQRVTSFGRFGQGPGEFSWPHGLAVDNSGVVYVCGAINNCIQLF